MSVGSQVVPTPILAEILEPLLRKLDRELGAESAGPSNNYKTDSQTGNGAVENTAHRAAAIARKTPNAVTRRLYEIRNWQAKARTRTDIDYADSLLLALDRNLSEEPLPVMPSNTYAAREMAEVWTEGEKWSRKDQIELATSLYRFCHGFLYGVASDVPETLCALAAYSSTYARTLLEHDGSVVSEEQVGSFQRFCRGFYHGSLPLPAAREVLRREENPAYREAVGIL